MASLLEAASEVTGSRASLVWVTPEVIEEAGIQPWTELPIWLPPDGESAGFHDGDVSAAYAAGLTCRPVGQTVADTWRWLREEGYPPPGRIKHGLSPEVERRVLASLPR
jgi:2'-hydroxyisoflavone reductase